MVILKGKTKFFVELGNIANFIKMADKNIQGRYLK